MLLQFAFYRRLRNDIGRQKCQPGSTNGILYSGKSFGHAFVTSRKEYDLTWPRFAAYKQNWKVHPDAVYWIDIRLAQRQGLKFFQTKSNAIILYDTLPLICIERVVSTKTQEVFYTETYRSPRPVPTVTF